MEQNSREAANRYMRTYMRKWREKNPEKCKAYRERYWAKRAEREAKAAELAVPKEKEGDTNNG